ncbi:MAG: LptF/LptG family permease, partial [Kiritimatiellaeota bacterium]|nr:LptF/LptG family permease [Kiritimatiellota bacterium]
LSLWQITAPVILASVVLTLLCLVINGSIAPASHWAQRRVLVELGVTDPLSMLEEGRFTRDIPGVLIYVGKKERAQATDVHIYELGENGVKRSIRAKRGTFVVDKESCQMMVTLFDARAEEPDPNNPSNPTQMTGGSGKICRSTSRTSCSAAPSTRRAPT